MAAETVPYKIVCISLYREDVAHVDALVERLRREGCSVANRSAVLRAALYQVDAEILRESVLEEYGRRRRAR